MISKQYRTFNDKVHELMAKPYHFRYTGNGLPYYNDGDHSYVFAPPSADYSEDYDNEIMMRLKLDKQVLTEIRRAQEYLKETDMITNVTLGLDITADPDMFGPIAMNSTEPKESYYAELRMRRDRCSMMLSRSQNAKIDRDIYSIGIHPEDLHATFDAKPFDNLVNAIRYGTALEINHELTANRYTDRLRNSDSIHEHLIIQSVTDRINQDYLNRQQHESLFDLFYEQGWLSDVNITDELDEDVRAQVMAESMGYSRLNKKTLSL